MSLSELIYYCATNKTYGKINGKVERAKEEWADALSWAPRMAGIDEEVIASFSNVDLQGSEKIDRLPLVYVCRSEEVRIYDIKLDEGTALGLRLLYGRYFLAEKFGITPTLVKAEILDGQKVRTSIVNSDEYYSQYFHENSKKLIARALGRNN